LEALAIFVGVTAGFFVENYRQQLNEKRQEREALEQLLRDLEIDADDITPIVETSKAITEGMIWLHNNLQRADLPRDSIVLVLDQIPWTYSYEAANAAYTGLKSAGQLALIRDLDLRREIVFYFEDRQAAMEQLNTWILEAETRWWDRVAPYVTYDETDSFLGSRPPLRTVDIRGMRTDPLIPQEVVWNGGANESQAAEAERILGLNSGLAAAVEAYLTRR
jgi:hypothetical protein